MADFDLIENLSFTTLDTIGHRARIGLVVLSSDYTVEHEFRLCLNALAQTRPDYQLGDVALYQSRIANSPNITPETLAAMEPTITETAQRLLPDDHLDVLAYGCTSASMVLGPERICHLLNEAKPDAKTTNPVTSAFAAFHAFGAKKIAVLTPYRRDVNQIVRAGLLAGGFEVPIFGSFNEELDPVVATIDTQSLKVAIKTLVDQSQVDAVFVSCTSVQLMQAVEKIEAEIGLPVTSSNHAMAWHCLRLARIDDEIEGLGRLFKLASV